MKTGWKADGGRKVAKEAGQNERQEKNTEREGRQRDGSK